VVTWQTEGNFGITAFVQIVVKFNWLIIIYMTDNEIYVICKYCNRHAVLYLQFVCMTISVCGI
jgi:uncharacterized secreted protein with C-terminal beta-propeller domain